MSVSSDVPTGTIDLPVYCEYATELECRDNELGYMYHYNLGGKANNPTGKLTGDQGFIQNLQRGHWSGTQGPNGVWGFYFNYGGQGEDAKLIGNAVWAVRKGDVVKPNAN